MQNENKALHVVGAVVGAVALAFLEATWWETIHVFTVVIGAALGAGAVQLLSGKQA